MHETNAEFEIREEENVIGIWALGLFCIVLGVIALLYYLRYVASARLLLNFDFTKTNTIMMAPAFEPFFLLFITHYLNVVICATVLQKILKMLKKYV